MKDDKIKELKKQIKIIENSKNYYNIEKIGLIANIKRQIKLEEI